jgi:ATP-dependent helicase/DNAse subunit B
LQLFAVCPYQFLLSTIHGLRPKSEKHALQQIEPMTRGHMFHKVQATVLRRLQTAGTLPLTGAGLADALALLNATLDEIALRYNDDLSPAIDQVWQDGVERMRADLRGWLHGLARDDRWRPIHFEFAFGLGPAPDRDPMSLATSITLSSGHRLHGIVDLIERSTDHQSLRITDHKTGVNDSMTMAIIAGGESLQPVLYGLAVETAFNERVTEGRLSFCTAAGGFSERIVPIDDVARKYSLMLLNTIDRAVEEVFLVPAPKPNACNRCKFITVCGPYEEIRISSKTDQARLKHLHSLRKLR